MRRRCGCAASVTNRLPPDRPGKWLTVPEAAARLGLSPSGFRGLAKRVGIAIQRRGNRPGVPAWEVKALQVQSQIPTGSYGRGSVPYKGRSNAAEVRHLELLDAVVNSRRWTDAQVARALGLHSDRIPRWRSRGVPNCYVPALRALRNGEWLPGPSRPGRTAPTIPAVSRQ